MRRETVQHVRQAVSAGRRAYVLVNNRSEVNAPMTVANKRCQEPFSTCVFLGLPSERTVEARPKRSIMVTTHSVGPNGWPRTTLWRMRLNASAPSFAFTHATPIRCSEYGS